MASALPPASAPAALVTGGARRIGRAIVLALARAGYAVAIHANRSLNAAAELRDNIARDGGRAGVVAADLADHACVLGIVPAAVAAVGPLTLLVNNASEFNRMKSGTLIGTGSIAISQSTCVRLCFWRRFSPRKRPQAGRS